MKNNIIWIVSLLYIFIMIGVIVLGIIEGINHGFNLDSLIRDLFNKQKGE